ncbi:histidine phosphatase family protein [Clostridium oceanicum]|uniref:Histidine phosphatase family protein n=1 Tax=Clostridium oceanicum TaxID=1543 RepID=A0ABP3V1I1_9CLOT
MNTQIWLIRHGETEWNAYGKFQGCKDIPLSSEGILQAKFLKKRFDKSFDLVYVSPLKRAIETAKTVCENTGTTPIISNQLREINFGEWEGLTVPQIKSQYTNQFKIWKTDEIAASLVGGDLSLKNASIRSKKEIMKIAKENKGKKIIIVAHGGIIKAGLIGIFDWKMTMYHKLVLGNTAISKLSFDEDFNPTLVSFNDTNHLPKDYKIKSYV